MDTMVRWNVLKEFVSDGCRKCQSMHVILGVVCLTGVLLAYYSDEEQTKGYAKSVFESDKPRNSTAEDNDAIARFQLSPLLQRFLIVIYEIYHTVQNGAFYERISKTMSHYYGLLMFVMEAGAMKRSAKTRRQFFYMMQKRLLGVPIKKDETEVQSYLDAKRALGDSFPFMWEVADVKEDKVMCDGYECVPMSSYSYLDLLRSKEVQEAAIEAARLYSTGNHGPRMLGGNLTILMQLEREVSNFFCRDGTLLCAAGYLACMSAVCAVAHEGDVIFTDARAHASLRAGMKLSPAKTIIFKHNDFRHAEKMIKTNRHKYSNAWMVIESVYSMDGDIADLPAAHYLAGKYNLNILLDEAHGLGVLGKTGRGLEEHFNMPGAATIICGTFSKSIASIGGYITGPKDWIDYMDFHAPGNVFSAPLPAYCAGAALKSFELIDRESWRVAKAQDNSAYLRHALETGLDLWPVDYSDDLKYELEGDVYSTVIPVVFPDDLDRTIRIATHMKKAGFMVSAVAFPACPLRRPRFRITATAAYTRKLIDCFVEALIHACVLEPPSAVREKLKTLTML